MTFRKNQLRLSRDPSVTRMKNDSIQHKFRHIIIAPYKLRRGRIQKYGLIETFDWIPFLRIRFSRQPLSETKHGTLPLGQKGAYLLSKDNRYISRSDNLWPLFPFAIWTNGTGTEQEARQEGKTTTCSRTCCRRSKVKYDEQKPPV